MSSTITWCPVYLYFWKLLLHLTPCADEQVVEQDNQGNHEQDVNDIAQVTNKKAE